MADDTCSVDGCRSRAYVRGWCRKHYARWLHYGDENHQPRKYRSASSRKVTFAERIWTKFRRTDDGCWVWTGARSDVGYGNIFIDGRTVPAHRAMYELLVEPIPDGLQLDHLCVTPACVNPAHLEPVTPRVNNLRSNSQAAIHARKTHCNRGHPLSGDNLYPRSTDRKRLCRACQKIRNDLRKQRSTA